MAYLRVTPVVPPPATPKLPIKENREIATLVVNGRRFEDWEFVMVRRNWSDPFAYFQFSATERDPVFKKTAQVHPGPDWKKLQFKPGDHCQVYMAGELAITGFIEVRQVAYDANQHGVMLLGKSYTAQGAKSSVDTKTGNFDGKTIHQSATEAWAPYGVTVQLVGNVDMTPFKHLQNNKGETVWDFCERMARDRSVRLACDAFGNFLLIGDHTSKVVAGLVEGKNILSMQCVIDATMVFEKYDIHGSSQGSDEHHGTEASEQKAERTSSVGNLLYSKIIVPIEEGVGTQAQMELRAEFERKIHDGQHVQATITVQGWLREGKELWQEGSHVYVYSPMAMLDEELAIQQVVFTQDDKRGSISVLTCVNPEWLNARPSYNLSGRK